jgi:inosine/xanthosine triphosphatase
VVVGSKNEAKIAAVQEAFGLVYDPVTVNAVHVDHTPRQPMNDEETLAGAKRRASAARVAAPEADFWVGIEGGVEPMGTELMVIAWVVVMNRARTGCSRSASYQLPAGAADTLRSGGVLGDVSERVTGDNWRSEGLVANLSYGLVTRTSLYVQPVILALLPLLDTWKDV